MRISTWNTQGNAYNNDCSSFAEAKNRMYNDKIDVLCLQEAGNLFTIIDPHYWSLLGNNFYETTLTIGTRSRGNDISVYYYFWGTVNFRCSMAILVRKNLNPGGYIAFEPMNNGTRPIIGIIVNNNLAVYNIHAPSGVPDNISCQYVDNTLKQIRALQQKYYIPNIILTGDFNCHPDLLRNNLNTNPYTIYNPKYLNGYAFPTQKGGHCLDYCIASFQIQNIFVQNENMAYSDHSQVYFDF